MVGKAKAEFDVVVVGSGIAGLSAAVSAVQAGARVAILERSVEAERGGNTRWTEAYMRMKNENEVAEDFEEHFMANSGHHLDPAMVQESARPYADWPANVKTMSFTDPDVVGTLAEQAGPTLQWLKGFGLRFADMPTYLLTQSTTRIVPVGGGLGMIDQLADYAVKHGAQFFYETTARSLLRAEDGSVNGIRANGADGCYRDFHGEVVLASGGFQGNAEMQARYYGAASRFIRPVAQGGYYNKGEGIQMALDIGAATAGDFSDYHAEPIDPRSGAPEPIVFVFPYGIVVDNAGRRFVDEASGTVDAIYENIARRIAHLPGGIAWMILDSRLQDIPNWRRAVRSDVPPITADTLEQLAEKIRVPFDVLGRTVADYNAATPGGESRPLELDGLSTIGLTPPKSNWAQPLDRAPYMAWPMTSANCFTFGGLRCNADAQVLFNDSVPVPGLYAAGETMGLYYGRYTGATSVLRGAVFGKIAGAHAAARAAAASRKQQAPVRAVG